MSDNNTKATLGLSENIVAVLCYAFGWLGGIIFLILEKENRFIKFHALQSLATFLMLFIISIIANFIPFLGGFIAMLITPISVLLWLFLMYKAYQGEKYKLPLIGNWVERQINH